MEYLGVDGLLCSLCYNEKSKIIYCNGQELFSGVVHQGLPVCGKDDCIKKAKIWCEENNMKVAQKQCDGYVPIPVSDNIVMYPDTDGKMESGRLSGLIIVEKGKVYAEVWKGKDFPPLSECPCIELHQGKSQFQPLRKWVEIAVLKTHNSCFFMMFNPKTKVQIEMMQTMTKLFAE